MIVNSMYMGFDGSGGETTDIEYDNGDIFGSYARDRVSPLSIATSGHIGWFVIFTVMHREAITVDSSWQLIRSEESITTEGITQTISIYKKEILNDNETFSITQNTSNRIVCSVTYFNSDIDIDLVETVAPVGTSPYIFDLTSYTGMSFIVYNSVLSASGTCDMELYKPPILNATVSYNGSVDYRLITFVNYKLYKNLKLTGSDPTAEVYIYSVAKSTNQGGNS